METEGALLFDLDGTLTDPLEGIAGSIRYALDKLSILYSPDETFAWCVGPPLIDSFLTLTGGDRQAAEDAIVHYRDRFKPIGMYENLLYPGVSGTLSRLRNDHWRLFVATSKPTPFAEEILRHFEIHDHFDAVQGSTFDGRLSKKADIIKALTNQFALNEQACIMIGDRMHDMVGAKQNRMRAIGVLWGYGSEQELRDHGADRLCAQFTQLPEAIHAVTTE